MNHSLHKSTPVQDDCRAMCGLKKCGVVQVYGAYIPVNPFFFPFEEIKMHKERTRPSCYVRVYLLSQRAFSFIIQQICRRDAIGIGGLKNCASLKGKLPIGTLGIRTLSRWIWNAYSVLLRYGNAFVYSMFRFEQASALCRRRRRCRLYNVI